MSNFLRTVIVPDVTPAADGTYPYDLPVNPLSHLIFTIKGLNATDEATVAEILAQISNIEVSHRGTSIINMNAADLYALNMILLGNSPILLNSVATDNATRALSLIVPFSRQPFDLKECFPRSKRGDLLLQITVDIATAAFDGIIFQVEAVELLDASPSRHLKVTTLTHTPSATGDSDIELPIAYTYAGILLWGTTIVTSTAWTNTIEQVKLLADNTERLYSLANWESLRGDLVMRCGDEPGHIVAKGDDQIAHYAYLDFSPYNSDDFLLNTAPLNALTLRITAGDTNACRALPVELLPAR